MRFLLATDGSEGALHGARLLAHLPLRETDEIAILTCLQDGEATANAEAALSAAETALASSLATKRRLIRRGNAAQEILDAIIWAAEAQPADIIVVGSHGRTGLARFLLGSVAERVARFANTSVLLARPPHGGAVDRVLIGIDGSDGSERAVRLVGKLPLMEETEVRMLGVTPHPFGARFGKSLLPAALSETLASLVKEDRKNLDLAMATAVKEFQQLHPFKVTADIQEGDPAATLIAVAEKLETDLMAVGAEGASEAERYFLGSVADRVLRHAHCSVLVVRKPVRW